MLCSNTPTTLEIFLEEKKKTEKARVTAFLDNVSRMYSFGENPYQRNDKISDSGLERTPEAFGSESHS